MIGALPVLHPIPRRRSALRQLDHQRRFVAEARGPHLMRGVHALDLRLGRKGRHGFRFNRGASQRQVVLFHRGDLCGRHRRDQQGQDHRRHVPLHRSWNFRDDLRVPLSCRKTTLQPGPICAITPYIGLRCSALLVSRYFNALFSRCPPAGIQVGSAPSKCGLPSFSPAWPSSRLRPRPRTPLPRARPGLRRLLPLALLLVHRPSRRLAPPASRDPPCPRASTPGALPSVPRTSPPSRQARRCPRRDRSSASTCRATAASKPTPFARCSRSSRATPTTRTSSRARSSPSGAWVTSPTSASTSRPRSRPSTAM